MLQTMLENTEDYGDPTCKSCIVTVYDINITHSKSGKSVGGGGNT